MSGNPANLTSTAAPRTARVSTRALTYKGRLSADLRWALSEGERFFAGSSEVHESLRRITRQLDELGIPYAVAGGMALFAHGYRRFTEEIGLLVTREGLRRIHQELENRDYVRPFDRCKNLFDGVNGVKINFSLSGDYPGDGKPKPVVFPNPADVVVHFDGIAVLALPALVTLKLAAGMTDPGRLRELVDVEELIRLLDLPETFSEVIDPYVQETFLDRWRAQHALPTRYVMLWHIDVPGSAPPQTLDELIEAQPHQAPRLCAMRENRVTLDAQRTTRDTAYLVTTERSVAHRFEMHDEADMLLDS
jgi:hypothetical protein